MKYQGLVDESEIQEEIDRIREDNLLLSKWQINEKQGVQAMTDSW
jgi:hypothetical protein